MLELSFCLSLCRLDSYKDSHQFFCTCVYYHILSVLPESPYWHHVIMIISTPFTFRDVIFSSCFEEWRLMRVKWSRLVFMKVWMWRPGEDEGAGRLPPSQCENYPINSLPPAALSLNTTALHSASLSLSLVRATLSYPGCRGNWLGMPQFSRHLGALSKQRRLSFRVLWQTQCHVCLS